MKKLHRLAVAIVLVAVQGCIVSDDLEPTEPEISENPVSDNGMPFYVHALYAAPDLSITVNQAYRGRITSTWTGGNQCSQFESAPANRVVRFVGQVGESYRVEGTTNGRRIYWDVTVTQSMVNQYDCWLLWAQEAP